MAKIYTNYSHGNWTVGKAPDDAVLGIEFQDSDDQQVIHEKFIHSSLDNAVSYIKNEYEGRYDSLVENHGVCYTNELAAEYPKEIKALGWDSAERRDRAYDFFMDMIYTRKEEFSAYDSKESFKQLLNDVSEYYELKKSGDVDLAGDCRDYGTSVFAKRLMMEAKTFDSYDFADRYESDDACYEEIRNGLETSLDYIKGMYGTLCEHYESIHDEPFEKCNIIAEIDKKYPDKPVVSRGEMVSNSFDIKQSETGVQLGS